MPSVHVAKRRLIILFFSRFSLARKYTLVCSSSEQGFASSHFFRFYPWLLAFTPCFSILDLTPWFLDVTPYSSILSSHPCVPILPSVVRWFWRLPACRIHRSSQHFGDIDSRKRVGHQSSKELCNTSENIYISGLVIAALFCLQGDGAALVRFDGFFLIFHHRLVINQGLKAVADYFVTH